MMNYLKKYCLNILLVLFYTGIAMTVYIIWFDHMWHLWYVDVIIGVVICAIGAFLGYLYLKSEMKAKEPEKYGKKIEENNAEEQNTGDETSGE